MTTLLTKSPSTLPSIQDALAALHLALGFDTMAAEAQAEQDPVRLSRHARIIVRNYPESKRLQLTNNFRLLGLL